jgi:nucleoside permease NupC
LQFYIKETLFLVELTGALLQEEVMQFLIAKVAAFFRKEVKVSALKSYNRSN